MPRRRRESPAETPAEETTPDAPTSNIIAPRSETDLAGSPEAGRERVMQLSDALGRQFGVSTALPLSVAPNAKIRRLPFGILMLDWKTRGGMVMHRLNRLWGPKSTLKSTLCLRAVRSAQRTCRHCKYPLVKSPQTGELDCRCPKPRYWLKDAEDYSWLPYQAAIAIAGGQLPAGAATRRGEAYIKCEPPAHVKVSSKAREIPLIETIRCEPMRCAYLDNEHTIDEAWCILNGVDPSLVLLIGGKWGEQSIESTELAMESREFDLIVIDSTSVLEPKTELEKSMSDRAKVAAKAMMCARWARRMIALAAAEGLTARYTPTVLCTSQATTKGIGGPTPAYLGSTDGNAWEHACSLDIKMTEAGYTFDPTKTKAIYGKFGFKVTKNKAGGSPGVVGQIKFWLVANPEHAVGDSDDLATVMDYARKMGKGYIDEDGDAALELYTPYVSEGKVPFTRVGDCEEYLRLNPTVYDDLRERVLTTLIRQDQELVLSGAEGPVVETTIRNEDTSE
jgi:RecA/RadA recombinase